MATGITIKIEGGEEIQRQLQRLDSSIQKELMEQALLAAAEPIRVDASRRAPRRTGKLSKSIISEKGKKKNTVLVGPDKNAFYGLFVEIGTSNSAARPFLRPAIDSQKKAAEQVASKILREGIERVLQ